MTRTRYYLARFAKSFGILRKQKRMRDAAAELHLMQEGEELLGELCWKKCEAIEETSLEYWQLRKLGKKQKKLQQQWEEAEEVLETSRSERAQITDRTRSETAEMAQEKERIELSLEEVLEERDGIIADATAVRRKYDSLKLKISVLEDEGEDEGESYQKAKSRMAELKKQFSGFKKERFIVGEKISELESDLEEIKTQLAKRQAGGVDEDVETYSVIAKANRDITKCRAELGLITEEQSKLYRVMGRHLALNARTSPECREATRDYRNLVQQIDMLRQSVTYIHALIGEER